MGGVEETLRISVTHQHIDKGLENCIGHGVVDHCTICPIALAIIEQTSTAVDVASDYVRFRHSGGVAYLPLVARQFIRKFELWASNRNKPKPLPFEFGLPIPA